MPGVQLRSGKKLPTMAPTLTDPNSKSSNSGNTQDTPVSHPPNHDSDSLPPDEETPTQLLLAAGFSPEQIRIFLTTFDADTIQVSGAVGALRSILNLEIDSVRDQMRSQLEQAMEHKLAQKDPRPGGSNVPHQPTPPLTTPEGNDNRSRSKPNSSRSQPPRGSSGLKPYTVPDSSDEEGEIGVLSFQRKKNHKIPNTYKFAGSDKDDVHSFVRNMEKQQKQAMISDADMAIMIPYHLTEKALFQGRPIFLVLI